MAMNDALNLRQLLSPANLRQLGAPLLIIMILSMMVLPLPVFLLDVFFTFNIAISVMVMLVAMYSKRPLDFSVFPTVLLVTTLLRLSLNVASTRIVLLEGHGGGDAAGKVIEAFGSFLVGGNTAVGLVVFVILTVINFVVITKGAGRIAEVSARFTLDAMPGKQMAIDADLNSGLIDEEEARRRRAEVHAEADFHGAMDGASKFVKGDAIAAIVITLVNLLGGFAIGVAQYGMPFGEAINTYSLLSVGDGLVSQIPALLLSVATGLIVTRSVADSDMGSDIVGQVFQRKMPLRVAGFGALALCVIPGLPKLPFLVAGGLMLLGASRIDESAGAGAAGTDADAAAGELVATPDTPEALVAEIRVDPLGLELSADLIDLVDSRTGGDLLDRVKALRRKVAGELGIVIPPVRTRDNLELPANTYAITLYGAEVARGEAPRGTVLAIGEFLGSLPGTPTREPVFGLDAK